MSYVSGETKYYIEVASPQGYDTVGSDFMAIGFGNGQFGIQANSSTQRCVYFKIYDIYNFYSLIKVVNLAKGPGVTVNTI